MHLVVEEKVDGSQAGLGFDENLDLIIFSRGAIAPRNRNFGPLWLWADARMDALFDLLSTRYILYGEWAMLLHSVYYDLLPDYFLEDDVYDRWEDCWLSTTARRRLLEATRDALGLHSVPVLHEGAMDDYKDLRGLVGNSAFKSDRWPYALLDAARRRGVEEETALSWTDPSDKMEGLYIKVEDGDRVTRRLKWVRYDFVQHVVQGQDHWNRRAPIPNKLVRK